MFVSTVTVGVRTSRVLSVLKVDAHVHLRLYLDDVGVVIVVVVGPVYARSYEIPAVIVSNQFFSKTAPTIFLIFCMKVHHYKGKKLTRRFFRKNSQKKFISNFVPKIAIFEGFWPFAGERLIFR